MKKALADPKAIRTTQAWETFLKALSTGVKRDVEEIRIPSVQIVTMSGNEPPTSLQYQNAIAVLYGMAYGVKMGLKFRKLPRPKGYYDFRIGALGTLWWSSDGSIDITNSSTLRWQAYLALPSFVTKKLLESARATAHERHPELPFAAATLTTLKEGRCVQVLHVGPYNQEEPTIQKLHDYMAAHGLMLNGKHHEIYISDPRRTAPAKLKTVIRLPVRLIKTR